MPAIAPVAPRQMLPPPTTTAISMPSSPRAAASSSAIRSTTPPSIVSSDALLANASPDSLRTTRRHGPLSSAPAMAVRAPALALADLDPGEPGDGGVLQELRDRRLRLLHEAL